MTTRDNFWSGWYYYEPRRWGGRLGRVLAAANDGGHGHVSRRRCEALVRAGVAQVVWYRLRAGLARRFTGYLSVALLVALVGGLALASVAGARRTESSYATYLASTNPSTVGLFTALDDPSLGFKNGYNPALLKKIDRLPLVEHEATALVFDGNINLNDIKGIHYHLKPAEAPPTFIGSANGELSTQDRVTLVAGRMANPKRMDEAVMDVEAAEALGLHIGSVIRIPFYTDAQVAASGPVPPPHLVATVKMVGEVVTPMAIVQGDASKLASAIVIFSPALSRALESQCTYASETYLKVQGGDRNARRVLAEIAKIFPQVAAVPVMLTSAIVPAIEQSIEPEALALGVFGGVAGLALLLISGLMVARLLRVGAEETNTLRALGAGRAMLLGDGAAGLLGALLAGSLLAVAVAVGLSPLAPLGPVRPVYPNTGVNFDWTILGLGFLTLLVVLGLVLLLLARREVRRAIAPSSADRLRREPLLLRSAANSRLPISAVTGVRFALDPGKGKSAAPVRSAMVGAVLAVAVLVSTVTFGASLDGLVSHPALYGWNFNYALLSGFSGQEDLPAPQTATLLDEDADVAKWSGVNFISGVKLDGQREGAMAEEPNAKVAPPVLSGHELEANDQIVLGGANLRQLHKKLGDTVAFSNGLTKPTRLVIVGTATFPAFQGGSGMGTGVLVSPRDFPASLLNLQQSSIPGPNAVLVRVRSGVSPAAAYRTLEGIVKKINALPNESGSAGGVVSVLRPLEIANFRSMGTTPTILAGGLALGAIVALGLTLGASVRRRRRDLALLKALGFTQRQLATAIAYQACVAALVGVVVGVPVGIEVGRELWTLFARSINAVPDPTVPVLSTILIAVGALIFANVVAALPGRLAARTPTALVLRAE